MDIKFRADRLAKLAEGIHAMTPEEAKGLVAECAATRGETHRNFLVWLRMMRDIEDSACLRAGLPARKVSRGAPPVVYRVTMRDNPNQLSPTLCKGRKELSHCLGVTESAYVARQLEEAVKKHPAHPEKWVWAQERYTVARLPIGTSPI